MLSLNIKHGEYITVSDNIVIQVLPDGGWATLLVDAPREIPILRGKLRERAGMERPESIYTDHVKRRSRNTPSDKRKREQYQARLAMWQERKDSARAAIDRISEIVEGRPEQDEVRELLARFAPFVEDSQGISADEAAND